MSRLGGVPSWLVVVIGFVNVVVGGFVLWFLVNRKKSSRHRDLESLTKVYEDHLAVVKSDVSFLSRMGGASGATVVVTEDELLVTVRGLGFGWWMDAMDLDHRVRLDQIESIDHAKYEWVKIRYMRNGKPVGVKIRVDDLSGLVEAISGSSASSSSSD